MQLFPDNLSKAVWDKEDKSPNYLAVSENSRKFAAKSSNFTHRNIVFVRNIIK